MKLTFLFILPFLLLSLNSKGAEDKLRIYDSTTREAIPGVTVQMKSLDKDDKSKTKLLTTNKEGFVINPFTGKTLVSISCVGYKTIIDTLNGGSKEYYLVQTGVRTDEVVVTGHFKPTSIQKSVFDIKVIDEATITNKGAVNLRDLLKTEANMRISQDAILGSSLSINGVSGENIKIMVDGVPVIGRLNGDIDLSQVNMNNIEQVEIIEGPMSTIYGSDALGGVINLISKDGSQQTESFDIGTYMESVGQYNFDANYMKTFGKYYARLGGGRNLFQGFDRADTNRNIRWNPKEQYFADLQFGYNLSKHRFRISSNYFYEYILNRGNLRPPYNENAFDDKYYTNRLTSSIFYNGELSENKFLNFTGSYSYYNRKKNTFFKDMTTLDETLTENESDQDTSVFYTWMGRVVFSEDKLTEELKYQLGGDATYDVAEGKKIKDNKQDMTDVAGFLSLQYSPFYDVLLIQPSVRFIYNSKYEAPIVPAVNLKYNMMSNLVLRASYAKGFRSPSIKELYYQFVDINHNIFGNEDLKAETSDSYNASIIYSLSDAGYFLSFEPKFFYNQLKNMITLGNVDGDIYQNINIGEYETIGANFTIKYFTPFLSVKSIFSYIGRLNYLYETDQSVPKFNFSPEFSLNADYLIEPIDTKLNFYYKFTGESPAFRIENEQPIEYYINSYNMMDISLSKNMLDMFTLVAGVKNLFNVRDINSTNISSDGSEATYPIGWGRTFFLNFRITIN